METQNGVAGYTANADGGGSTAPFTIPLKQVVLSWPAQSALLLTTKSAAGVPGIAFSVNTSSGLVTPLIHAEGLTATADRAFSRIVYQATIGQVGNTYARVIESGVDIPLSLSPFPEKCLWSNIASVVLYCATPIRSTPVNFLDLWHLGATDISDSLSAFNALSGASILIAIPGGLDGGVQTSIAELALSPEERYLSFIARGTRALWGVRLGSF